MEFNDYDTIADLYDLYMQGTSDIAFFVGETKRSSGEVLELMAGTGRVSIPIIEAGVKLTCVDLSAESNAILESKLHRMGLKADVVQMDVCELELGKKFELIIIPYSSFAHITSPDDQRKALARIRHHLLPGGTFICTLPSPVLRRTDVDGQLQFAGRYPLSDAKGTVLLWSMESFSEEDDEVVEGIQFYEEYDAKGVLTSKRLFEVHFRLSRRDEFEELAEAAGFKVQALYGDYSYSEFSDDSPLMIWFLQNAA